MLEKCCEMLVKSYFVKEQGEGRLLQHKHQFDVRRIDSDDNWSYEQLASWGNQHRSQVRLPSFCLLSVLR